MKHILVILSVFFIHTTLYGQITPASQWVWVSGDSTKNVHAVYGTKGIAAATNNPGGRSSAASFKDASGNIWIFGGWSSSGFLNDLWKYDPATNQWTWVSGDSAIRKVAVYGTKGVPSVNNKPSGRCDVSLWADAAGDFWIFGGLQYVPLWPPALSNELWKYTTSTDEWTWVNGDISKPLAEYGIKGVPSASNWPSVRTGSATWQDNNGNFWLYGGGGLRPGGLTDLWKYSPATNQWTWMLEPNPSITWAQYGTKGVSGEDNNPGMRENASTWTDNDNNLWLFGGFYDPMVGRFHNNDIWKYNPGINQWTWINGDSLSRDDAANGESVANSSSVYGAAGVFSAFNKPSGRGYCYSATDNNGNLLIWGGESRDVQSMTELWKYNVAANQWAWIKDTLAMQPGRYVTKGVASPGNIPGGRKGGISWIDASGNFYIYGGIGVAADGSGWLNDLWKLAPGNVLAVQMANITAHVTGEKIAVEWQTLQENNSAYFIIEHSSNGIDFAALGKTAAAGNSTSLKEYSFIDDHPFDGVNFYRIKVFNLDGTFSYSRIATAKTAGDLMMRLFPNPAKDIISVQLNEKIKSGILQIMSADGRIVKEDKVVAAANSLVSIDLKNLPSGTYHILLKSNTGYAQQKFIKQ